MSNSAATDKGLAGFSFTSQLTDMQTNGPLSYTTYDVIRHFAWMISIIKFLAHIFSLPVMALLRRNFGMRYVDHTHIMASFIVWQIIGVISMGAGAFVSQVASPLISIIAWLALPVIFYHRHDARQAALRAERYSYHPGYPRVARLVLPLTVMWCGLLGRIYRTLGLPLTLALAMPKVLTAEIIQAPVRRFVEPALVGITGLLLATTGISEGFGMFLIWTGLLLHIDEALTQRTQWELFLDAVDAQVVGREKEQILAGMAGDGSATGFSLATAAALKQPA